MTITPATTLEKLLKEKYITRKMYNALKYRKMETLRDLLEWKKEGKLKRPFFGKDSLQDIKSFLNRISELQLASVEEKGNVQSPQLHHTKKEPPVEINYDSTIEQLHTNGLLSDQAFSALFLMKVRDVEQLMDIKSKGYLDRHHFSLDALSNLKDFFDRIEGRSIFVYRHSRYIVQSSKQSDESMLSHDLSSQIEKEMAIIRSSIRPYESMAYETISKLDGQEADLLRELFPNAHIMADAILNENYNLLTIYKDLGKSGNVTFRRLLLHYLKAIKKFSDGYFDIKSAYYTASRLIRHLESNINSFTYQEIIQNFLSSKQRQHLEHIYQNRVSELDDKARTFQQTYLTSFTDLVELFGLPEAMVIERYKGMLEIAVIHEIWLMAQDMEDIFYEEANSGKEILLQMKIAHLFPMLTSAERRFVFLFHQENDSMPLFYIIHSMLTNSKRREIANFVFYMGIRDGMKHTLEEVAKKNRLTTERVRQICEKGNRIIRAEIQKILKWGDYGKLLDANYITELSPKYRRIQEEERLPQNFHIFCVLLSLLGDFEYVTIGEKEIAISKQFRSNGFYAKHIYNKLHGLAISKRDGSFAFDLRSLVSDLPSHLQEDALWIVIQIAKTIPKLTFDENWTCHLQRNYIDIPEECYNILAANNRPMTLEEIFQQFKYRHPDNKYSTPGQIRHYILKHEHIKPVGKTSTYGLDTWQHVFYGNIRDLLRQTLEASPRPMHIDKLTAIVKRYFPTTNAKSIASSMSQEEATDFISFLGGFFGLSSKTYSSKYIINDERRYTFNERLKMITEFISTYRRFPFSSGGDAEQSLQRWLYNVENMLLETTLSQEKELKAVLQPFRDAHLPENQTEENFLEMCQRYRAYIEQEFELPTRQGDIELYDWMNRSKANYNSYIDNRRHYLTELFNYINSLGFKI